MALFPIPVTTNLPLELKMISVAFSKSALSKSASLAIDLLSDTMVFLAISKIFLFVFKTVFYKVCIY
jgi:hypothetical protein